MNKFVIGKVDNENEIIIRLLDLDSGVVEDVEFDSFYKEAINNMEEYKNTNLNIILNNDRYRMGIIDTLNFIGCNTDSELFTVLKREDDGETFVLSNAFGKVVRAKEEELYNYNCINANVSEVNKKELTNLMNVVLDQVKKGDSELEKDIERQYNKFILKTKLLGKDNSFGYKIEGREVILTNYTGTSEHVVIPKFITTVGRNAFSVYWSNNIQNSVRTLELSEGLKKICTGAFRYSRINKLVLPRTVELVEKGAFSRSNLTYYTEDKAILDRSKTVVQNRRTVIEEWK